MKSSEDPSNFLTTTVSPFLAESPSFYPGYQRFFLRGFRCRSCFYSLVSMPEQRQKKTSGTQGTVLPPCVFGDKNGSKRSLPDNILSAEISPLELWKTSEATDSFFLGSKCNGYFEVVFARPHREERGIVKHLMTDYTRNSRQNI